MTSTARAHFVKPLVFRRDAVRCLAAKKCTEAPAFQIGWKYERKVMGKATELVTAKAACERHARIFCFKHGIEFRKVGA